MKGLIKRLCTGFLALATIATTLPTTVHASEKQYWTESTERVGIIEKVMNDGSISSTFNEGYMRVEGETAYCIDINTDFKNGYKTRADASTRMSADQIADVVTFEELYDLSDKDEPVKVAEHKDIEDDGQTVSIKERIINIHTRATDPEGEKSIVAGNKVTIIDTVKLDNLEIGTEYQLTGWQMLKEENAELLIDGKRVENSYTFTADNEDMEIEMEYTFNASALGGKNLVTFEELYDITDGDNPKKVAEHKDIFEIPE